MRRPCGHSYRLLVDRLRLLGIPSDWRDVRASVLSAVPYAAVLYLERDWFSGVPDVLGSGAVFGVRGPAQGGVCQCIDLFVGCRGVLLVQAFRGRIHDGDEAVADLRDVRAGGDADASDADGREDAL